MLKVMEFRKRIRALKEEGNALLVKSEAEKRELDPTEKSRFDAVNTEIDAVEARMDSYVRINRISAEELRTYEPQKPTPGGETRNYPRPFGSLGEQLIAIRNHSLGLKTDTRVLEIRAPTGMGETIPSDGGFLVQQDFTEALLKELYDTNEIPRRCRKIPISSAANRLTLNIVDETSRATGSRWGGVQVYRQEEAGATTATKPKFGKIDIKLEKMFGLCYLTDELLADAAALEAVVRQAFTEEIGFKLSDEIIRGTGAGQCLGILNSAALVSVAKETGQAADTVVTENILNMWRARRGRNLVWLYNQEIEPQLDTLTLSIGTGGVEMRLFNPPTTPGGFGSIKGAPAIPVEVCSGAGDLGDIILADLSQYLLIDKGGIQEAQSIHVQFLTDETTVRFIYRVNGAPMVKSALTPYKRTSSTFSLSPFVSLAAR